MNNKPKSKRRGNALDSKILFKPGLHIYVIHDVTAQSNASKYVNVV